MHQRTQPHAHSLRTPKLLLTHKTMQPAIPVPAFIPHVLRERIFFHPVDFEVSKRLAVEAAYGGKGVLAAQITLEKFFLVRESARLAPAVRYARIVHPFVQELGVVCGCGGEFVVQADDRGDERVGAPHTWSTGTAHVLCGETLVRCGGGGAAVDAGVFAEAGDTEAEVLAQRGNVAGVEGFTLPRWFGPDGVAGAVREGVLERWGRVERW